MRTDKQQQASRENGAHSNGPASSQGKANSAKNSLKHGLTARNPILLSIEDEEAYEQIRVEYENLFRPANIVERQLVDEMVSVQWRRQRAEALEAATLEEAIKSTASGSVAEAYDHALNHGKSLLNLQRLADRLSRHYLRLLKTFETVRDATAPSSENQSWQNEPGNAQSKRNLEFNEDVGPSRSRGEGWVPVLHAIVRALAPFPEAREAVLVAVKPYAPPFPV
jgi:hypothetical protein